MVSGSKGISQTLSMAWTPSTNERVSLDICSLCLSIFFRKDEAALQATILKLSGAPERLQERAVTKRSEKRCLYLIEMISMKRFKQKRLCPLSKE